MANYLDFGPQKTSPTIYSIGEKAIKMSELKKAIKDLIWNHVSSSGEPVRVPSQWCISKSKSRATIVLFLFIVSLLLGNLSEPPLAKAIEKLNTLKTAKALKGVSVTRRGKITQVTITVDGLIKDYNVFTLESPHRIVIDLRNLKNLFPKNAVYAKTSNLKRIRIGTHPKKVRVVLDFSGSWIPLYRINRIKNKLIVLLGNIKVLPPLIKIMPLGDSITCGSESALPYQISYRKDLWDSFKAAYYKIDFVGSQGRGWAFEATEGFDPDHEGHAGWTDKRIAHNVYNWLVAYQPDIVLLHIGTNVLDPSPNDVEKILDEIDRYSKRITVFLARIINRSCSTDIPPCPQAQMTTDFNDNVEAMALTRIANGDKIIIVDMENGAGIDYRLYPLGDMSDNLHPFATGYEKMANAWFDALNAFFSAPNEDLLPQK
jgi:lysophospholipase L1-like esterase